jgi:hypothetical protein
VRDCLTDHAEETCTLSGILGGAHGQVNEW